MNDNTHIHRPRPLLAAVMALALAGGCSESQTGGGTDPPGGRWFWSPQGLAATATHVLVANTAFGIEDGQAAWGQGFVTFVHRDKRQVVGRVDTSQPNTHSVVVRGQTAYVLNGGKLKIDQGLARPASGGSVDLLDLSAGVPARVAHSISLGLSASDPRICAYGSMVISPDGKIAYIGSGSRADVFSVDLVARQVIRGPQNPIALFHTPAGENGMTVVRPFGPDRLAVLDFNSEQLCISGDWTGQLKQRSCGSVKINRDLKAGPIDVLRAADGRALLLMNLANALYLHDAAAVPPGAPVKLAGTGLSANRLLLRGGLAYVINSLSANVQRVDPASGKSELPFAVLPTRSNPYDMVITTGAGGELAWVTLLKSQQLALLDLKTGDVLKLLGNDRTSDGGAADAGAPDAGLSDGPPGDGDSGGGPVVGVGAVVSSSFGQGAGFGQSRLPGVIQGGPRGGGQGAGSTDVLSLGVKGELVLSFGPHDVVDGPGPDLIVFENPMQLGPYNSYAEPAHVGLSAAGTASASFTEFPCDLSTSKGDAVKKTWPYPGCAGVQPVLANVKSNSISPTDPTRAGGDPFDLATIGLKQARYLRLRDAGISKMGNDSAGFDLDAVVLINYRKVR